jgi:acyl-homoserine lactone acylase PvdQ
MDEEIWANGPYRESDLQAQYDNFDKLYGAEGARVKEDIANYVAGIQAYINEARINPLLMPAEYAAIGRPGGPQDWSVRDVVATASVIGAIFGKGGGSELDSALALQAAQKRLGKKKGKAAWKDFRSSEDPEAPVTVLKKAFPYQAPPKKVAKGSLAMPDRGSVTKFDVKAASSGARAATPQRGVADGLLKFPSAMSNALLVSGKESVSGHPLAVFGPQVGYFNPQILNEVDLHGPGIDARGAAFNGVSLYVTLGRGRDYAWSATSASQDIIDTFAVPLCEPSGKKPTKASMSYVFRGKCTPMDVLERTNSWTPNLGDSTPAGSETLRAERTKLGLVTGRATIKGKPVAYTRLRSTYMHEADSAIGISRFNNPGIIRNVQDFQRAAYNLGYTFHWFYIDADHIGYINTGSNPVRAKNVDNDLPTSSKFEWRGFDPTDNTARYEPFNRRPQVIDQKYLVNWNNKGAKGYRAADSDWEYSSVYRSKMLEDRVKRDIAGARKMTLPQLVDDMEVAGYTDLRGAAVLPYALRVLGRPKDPRLRDAIGRLRVWLRAGAPRRDRNHDGVYEYPSAVRIMDAWWPLWIKAAYEPLLGADTYTRFMAFKRVDNDPNNEGAHLGSSYQGGTYGLTQRDLRSLLGKRRLKGLKGPPSKKARYSRTYCGANTKRKASLKRCRAVLERTLLQAVNTPASQVYPADPICGKQPGLGPKDPGRKPNDQWCWDAVWMRPLGAAEQPLIEWINRPTFQQVVEIPRRLPR